MSIALSLPLNPPPALRNEVGGVATFPQEPPLIQTVFDPGACTSVY